MGTGEIALVSICRTAVIGAAGALMGSALAAVASPLFPMGLARQAEIRPGLSLDPAVLVVGAVVAVVAVLVRAGLAARRVARAIAAGSASADAGLRRWRLASALAGAGLSAPASSGVGMALDPRPGDGNHPRAFGHSCR